MHQKTFSAAILAVVMSVVISPILLRMTIIRSTKRAVASIEAAQQSTLASYSTLEHNSASRNGSMVLDEVPVYYHLHTQSVPCWGLNARLMDALSDQALHILDFRSQHADFVINELYLKDLRLHAPPTHRLPQEKEGVLRQRVSAILAVLSPIFNDGGTVTLVRWLPGADENERPAAATGLQPAACDTTSDTRMPPSAVPPPPRPHRAMHLLDTPVELDVRRRRRPPRRSPHTSARRTLHRPFLPRPPLAPPSFLPQDDFELDLFNSYKSARPQTLEGFVNKTTVSHHSLLNQAAPSDAQDWEP